MRPIPGSGTPIRTCSASSGSGFSGRRGTTSVTRGGCRRSRPTSPARPAECRRSSPVTRTGSSARSSTSAATAARRSPPARAAASAQCPYHAWTYGLDGQLRAAPRAEREDDFDAAGLGLVALSLDRWGPFLFVNADPDTPPPRSPRGSRLPFDPAELVFRERIDYALGRTGRSRSKISSSATTARPPIRPSAAWSTSTRTRTGSRATARLEPVRHGPERRGALRVPSRLAGLKINVYPGFANLSIGPVWPETTGRTVGFLDYFFGADVDDVWARELIAFDDQVGREDTALVESVQRGVAAGLVERGRLLPESERLIACFQAKVTASLT